jgi:hypothetical protein
MAWRGAALCGRCRSPGCDRQGSPRPQLQQHLPHVAFGQACRRRHRRCVPSRTRSGTKCRSKHIPEPAKLASCCFVRPVSLGASAAPSFECVKCRPDGAPPPRP